MAAAPGVRRSELGDALRACRNAFIGVGAMSCMINLLYLTGSIFMLEVYDRVLPSRSVPTLVGLIILAGGLYIAQGVLDLIRGRILVRIGTALDETLNQRVFDTVVRLPLTVGGRNEGLQPLRDLDNVRSFLSGMGPGAFFDLPWLPFYLAICFAFHVMIGLTALVGAIILVILTVVTEYHVARAGARGDGPGGAPQRSGRHQPAKRRGAGGDGDVGAPDQALERGQREISCGQPARQRRRRRPRRDCQGHAHDPAVGGAGGRRLSRDPSGSDRRHHHRRLDPERAGAGAGRSCDRALERFRRRAAELASSQPTARNPAGADRSDAAAGSVKPPVGRGRQHRAAGRSEGRGPGRDVCAYGRKRTGHHRAKRIGQVVAGARAGRRVAAGARQGAARRRGARSMVVRRARPPCRLSAAGCRTVRGHGRPEYLPVRSGCEFRCHHRGRKGSRRPSK